MKSVDTALRVLSLFKDQDYAMGVVEIAGRLGLGKSHTSRILAGLRDMGYLEQDPATRKYNVGIEAFAIGSRFVVDRPIARAALPIMQACSRETGHSVFLSMLHGNVCRHVLAVEGRHFEGSQWRVGMRLPLHASASGKIFLAFSADDPRGDLLESIPLERHTANTITDRSELRDTIEVVRERKWATARSETITGLSALAVPVYGEHQNLVAAFGIVSPIEHLRQTDPGLVEELGRDARRLSYQMGARAYPEPVCA